MLYNALSMGKKTLKIAISPWDFVTPPEEDRATAICANNLVKIMHVVQQISSQTDTQESQTCSSEYIATAPTSEVTQSLAIATPNEQEQCKTDIQTYDTTDSLV